MVGIYIFCVFIYKFCYEWELSLVILLLINKKLGLCFYFDVLIFGLIVYLQLKDYKKFLFSDKKNILKTMISK